MAGSYWKFGDKYAGISPRGKRFVVETRSQAISKAGKSNTVSKSSKSAKKPKKGGSKTAKKGNKGGKRGARIVGNLGIKGLGVGAGLLAIAKFLVRRNMPQAGAYTTGIANIGAGIVGKTVFKTGGSLIQFGAVDSLSELLYDVFTPGGMYDLPGTKKTGGWDY